MNQTKRIETPYKDIHGKTICVGDIIVFGFLGQHWIVKQRKRKVTYYSGYSIPKGAFVIYVVSNDSGKGYMETMDDCGIEIPENQTEICTDHYQTTA